MNADLQQRVQNRLTLREGDTVTLSDLTRIRSELQQIDEHLNIGTRVEGVYNSQRNNVSLRIGLAPNGARPSDATPVARLAPIPGAVAVGGKVMESRVVQRVPPDYPSPAKLARVQGAVELGITIGTDGRVQNVQVISGPAMLTQAALDAVSQWVYQPFMLNGQPVVVNSTVTVNFVLN